MNVEKLIESLKGLNAAARVECEYQGDGGCDTCGYGSETTADIEHIYDFDSRVVLSTL